MRLIWAQFQKRKENIVMKNINRICEEIEIYKDLSVLNESYNRVFDCIEKIAKKMEKSRREYLEYRAKQMRKQKKSMVIVTAAEVAQVQREAIEKGKKNYIQEFEAICLDFFYLIRTLVDDRFITDEEAKRIADKVLEEIQEKTMHMIAE